MRLRTKKRKRKQKICHFFPYLCLETKKKTPHSFENLHRCIVQSVLSRINDTTPNGAFHAYIYALQTAATRSFRKTKTKEFFVSINLCRKVIISTQTGYGLSRMKNTACHSVFLTIEHVLYAHLSGSLFKELLIVQCIVIATNFKHNLQAIFHRWFPTTLCSL